MSKQGISHWETGRYEPNIDQIAALCDVLGVSADWLLLGRSPENLGPEAIEQGRFFTRLSSEQKKKWRTVALMFMDAAPDHEVERKMPITKRDKEKQ